MEEILYFGNSNSLCFQENLLSNNFLYHCQDMLKYVEIIDVNNNNNYNKFFFNEK